MLADQPLLQQSAIPDPSSSSALFVVVFTLLHKSAVSDPSTSIVLIVTDTLLQSAIPVPHISAGPELVIVGDSNGLVFSPSQPVVPAVQVPILTDVVITPTAL